MASTGNMSGGTQASCDPVPETLRRGDLIQPRAIRSKDKSDSLEHLAGLSVQSRHFCFLCQKRTLPHEGLDQLNALDYEQHVGIQANLRHGSRQGFIGVICAVPKQTTWLIEPTLAVLNEYQGGGIGPLLCGIRRVSSTARDINPSEADVRGDNRSGPGSPRRSARTFNRATNTGIFISLSGALRVCARLRH